MNSHNPDRGLDYYIDKLVSMYPILEKRGMNIYFKNGEISTNPILFYHYNSDSLLLKTEAKHYLFSTTMVLKHKYHGGTLCLPVDSPILSDEFCVELFTLEIAVSIVTPTRTIYYDRTSIMRRWTIKNIEND